MSATLSVVFTVPEQPATVAPAVAAYLADFTASRH